MTVPAEEEGVGPLDIAPKRYLYLLAGFALSVGLAVGMAGLGAAGIVAGLWIVFVVPIVKGGMALQKRKLRQSERELDRRAL